jgi:hypothetical protein
MGSEYVVVIGVGASEEIDGVRRKFSYIYEEFLEYTDRRGRDLEKQNMPA